MAQSSLNVRVLAFGKLRASFPADGLPLQMQTGDTVEVLRRKLVASATISADESRCAAIAVNREYASDRTPLADGDEVAILPPVSGGTGSGDDVVALIYEPIDTTAIQAALKSGDDGAVCVFDGMVRNNTLGRSTLHLDYEAYEEMALAQMRGLREQAIARFGVREVAIVHRLGRLLVGETSVLIVVASAHRGPAFEACRWVIDTLKKTVPIWKREQFVDGAVWADGEPFPEEIAGTKR
jgi:molybdopterin synthase catalytic subunit/molybdopterin converting factor small subunit